MARDETPIILPYETAGFDQISLARCVSLIRLWWQVYLDRQMPLANFVSLVRTEDKLLERLMNEQFARQKHDRLIQQLRLSGTVHFDPEVMADYPSEDAAYEDIVKVLMGIDRHSVGETLFIGNWDLPRYFEGIVDVLAECSSPSEMVEMIFETMIHVESERHDPLWVKKMANAMRETWSQRTQFLSPDFASTVTELTTEYLVWLHHHPDAISSIAWQAFERLVAEIFASRGFSVEVTARDKDRSADIVAVSIDQLGIPTKYLVECKCYTGNRKVGLDVVNAVIGAKVREGADHALLVTTSSFTSDVVAAEGAFRELRLHLKDGSAVQEWLRNLDPADISGTFVAPGWLPIPE
jgi:HJR/Mrr/RecB family endonuclease